MSDDQQSPGEPDWTDEGADGGADGVTNTNPNSDGGADGAAGVDESTESEADGAA